MNVKPIDFLTAIAYPVTESSVLLPLLTFWLMISLASWAGLFGLLLLFLVLPAVFRYQMIVLEARARGVRPDIPGIEFFNWFGSAWSLFPVPVVGLLVWAIVTAGNEFGRAAMIALLSLAGLVFPAFVAVLAITHSPLQSLNPCKLLRFLDRCKRTFWMATVFLIVAGWLSFQAAHLPVMLAILVQLTLSFSFFSLVGSLIKPYGLIEDIEIPALPDNGVSAEKLHQARAKVLSHAYGFTSRGNREGGFKHIFDWIAEDPDPAGAWAWFFNRMLRWEDRQPALFFARHYVHDQLRHGEDVRAVKVIMRCRLIDEQFRPFDEDRAAAIAACEACDNAELAAVFREN